MSQTNISEADLERIKINVRNLKNLLDEVDTNTETPETSVDVFKNLYYDIDDNVQSMIRTLESS